MKPSLLQSLLLLSGILSSVLALAGPPASAPCSTSANVADDGSVKLSNDDDGKCDPPAAPPAVTPPVTPPAVPAAAPDSSMETPIVSTRTSGRPIDASADAARADAEAARGEAVTNPRENYRNAMLLGTQGTTAANPAVSRRYKAMDRATYQAKVLGGVSPDAQADGQTSGEAPH